MHNRLPKHNRGTDQVDGLKQAAIDALVAPRELVHTKPWRAARVSDGMEGLAPAQSWNRNARPEEETRSVRAPCIHPTMHLAKN